MGKLVYPKMIQKEGEVMVVKDAYEHAEMCRQGWSGPPEFESAIPELEKEIAETETRLKGMKKRLSFMKAEDVTNEKILEEFKKGK